MSVRPEKVQQVEELTEKLSASEAVVLVDFRGLSVGESNELRRRLSEAGVEFRVVKNTLTLRAANQLGIEGLEEILHGPTAAAFALQDPVAPAKELTRFAKEFQKLTVKAGILGAKVVDAAEVQRLADLPSKEELLARVVGGASGPLYGFAAVTSGLLRKFAYALEDLRRQREGAA